MGLLTKFRACVGADDFASRGVAFEEQDIEGVGHVDELFFRDLLLTPEFCGLRCHRLLFEALRSPDMQIDRIHPARRFISIARSEPELSIVPIKGDFELTE